MTGRASGPKMLTAPAKSQLTIGHHPSPMKMGVCDIKPHHQVQLYKLIKFYVVMMISIINT